jgi:hypothetical protein
MRRHWLLAACAIGAAAPAHASEPFVGRWAISAEACAGRGDTPATAVLVATETTLSWFASYCRIGRMYKVGETIYLDARCWGSGDVPAALAVRGDRMQVTWNRARLPDMQRCK